MNIQLIDQSAKFDEHLKFLKTKKVIDYEKAELNEAVSAIAINTTKSLNQINLDFLFNYQIFPNNILVSRAQWMAENRKMKVGDTIAQQVYSPPLQAFSFKAVFGVRVSQIIDQPDKKGFAYETLQGHAEKGISTFTLEQTDKGLIFKIHTHSTPGNFLSKILGPVFTTPYQAYCTRKALDHVKQQIERQLVEK